MKADGHFAFQFITSLAFSLYSATVSFSLALSLSLLSSLHLLLIQQSTFGIEEVCQAIGSISHRTSP